MGAAGTDAVVEEHRIACSHFDAYRFFTPPAKPLNTLAPGQAATVEGSPVRVLFLRVSGDSRCPADALCVLGGDAIVLGACLFVLLYGLGNGMLTIVKGTAIATWRS